MNKPLIIPALLRSSFYEIEQQAMLVGEHVSTVQLDLIDGKFAPNTTWWFSGKNLDKKEEIMREERGLPLWESLNYEADLMLDAPLEHIDEVIALGPSRIIFHLSSIKANELVEWFETLSPVISSLISFSIAVRHGDDLEKIRQYESYIDDIQCMGMRRVGFQREPFDEEVLPQIKEVRKLFPTKTVTVDGAVSEQTIASLWNAGATRFSVGSALFQSVDILGTIETLEKICQSTPTQFES
jgi:pentose-5-phosphate-3-epimerase